MMKSWFVIACLGAASAWAQTVSIGAPADCSTVSRGTNITIEVNKPVRHIMLLHFSVSVRPRSTDEDAVTLRIL